MHAKGQQVRIRHGCPCILLLLTHQQTSSGGLLYAPELTCLTAGLHLLLSVHVVLYTVCGVLLAAQWSCSVYIQFMLAAFGCKL